MSFDCWPRSEADHNGFGRAQVVVTSVKGHASLPHSEHSSSSSAHPCDLASTPACKFFTSSLPKRPRCHLDLPC
jgi:hypothetical protein